MPSTAMNSRGLIAPAGLGQSVVAVTSTRRSLRPKTGVVLSLLDFAGRHRILVALARRPEGEYFGSSRRTRQSAALPPSIATSS